MGGLPTRYIFAGNIRVAKVSAAGIHYYHKDHLGSSTVMTDSAGASVETAEYLPYGGVRLQTSITVTAYQFTDQELDSETGLYNYNARLYDPVIGRFITADTMVPDPSNPQSLNRYSYCLNSPLMYVDPSGHFFGAIVAIATPIIKAVVGSAVVKAAAVGAVVGGATAAATGNDIGQGMLTGAISGAAFGAAGAFINSPAAAGIGNFAKAGIHAGTGAISGGINASITGGDMGFGILTGAVSAGFGKYAGLQYLSTQITPVQFAGYAAVGGISGGIASSLYGGSFGKGFTNGFRTAAYGFWFNQMRIGERVANRIFNFFQPISRNAFNNGQRFNSRAEYYFKHSGLGADSNGSIMSLKRDPNEWAYIKGALQVGAGITATGVTIVTPNPQTAIIAAGYFWDAYHSIALIDGAPPLMAPGN